MTKKELRKILRSRDEGAKTRNEQSIKLCRHLMDCPEYKRARVVGGYIPISHEADITPLLHDALRQGKKLALPLCAKAPDMTFRIVDNLDTLCMGRYGIPEPGADTACIDVSDIDLLLVPLEGVDHQGWRLGKGGGYYDKALSGTSVMSMGCALTWQWASSIPCDTWDVRLQACADANGIYVFGNPEA